VQAFCYDEQNRLTWAGSTGTPPCTGPAITTGTLAGAQYTQSFSYDNQDRLRSSPLGSYSYDDANHLHAATFVDSGTDDYSATYDASGNMLTRAPSESQPQQKLSYDNEGRLTAWQNAPTSPTSTAQYLYDGEGNRVEQQATTGGTTTTTVYVGSLESVATTSGTSTTTTYYYAGGQRIALAVNGTLSYLASDLLGSATVTSNGSGTPTASQLYAPYGGARYSNGAMPTDYGFTGQRTDVSTGLDYYGARYYDPTLGQFTSADTVLDGQNRYGYVGGNPINSTDPNGQQAVSVEKEDTIFGGAAGVAVTGIAITIMTIGSATAGTGGGQPTSVSVGPVATFTINGMTIDVVASGDIWVTKAGAFAPEGYYTVGSADWVKWTGAIDAAYASSDVWNARTAPTATTSSTAIPVSVVATKAGDGAGDTTGSSAAPLGSSGAAAAGGGSEPPGGDDPCTCGGPGSGRPTIRVGDLHPIHTPETAGVRPDLEGLTDDGLLQSVSNPANNDPLKINTRTGGVMDGNGRAYELLRRAGDPNSTITPDTRVPYEPYIPFTPWDSDLC
jgi:RHS repeat-associated protein